jgi:hypothetical protein
MEILLRVDEAIQAGIIAQYLEGRVTGQDAQERLELSRSAFFRRVARVRVGGPAALAHGLRGKRSNFRYDDSVKEAVLRLFREEYAPHGFGISHFVELAADKLPEGVSYPSVWRWLRAAGLVEAKRKGRRHRSRRPRKSAFGEMLQMDTSLHDWFGAGKWALVAAIDDATSFICGACLRPSDTTLANFETLHQTMTTFGLPQSVYVDRSPIFKVTRTGYGRVLKHIMNGPYITQVQRALEELGIELIFAYSPQAKGRVERGFRTWQSRLIPELKKEGIREPDRANAYIREVYLPRVNARFASNPANFPSAFVKAALPQLDFILAEQHTLRISNDHVVSSKVAGVHLKILPSKHRLSYAKAKVEVFKHVDGRVSVRYKDELLNHQPLQEPRAA